MTNSSKPIYCLAFLVLFYLSGQVNAQEAVQSEESAASSLSAYLFPARPTRAGGSPTVNFDDLEPLSKGLIQPFDVAKKYAHIFLGGDFYEFSKQNLPCDTLNNRLGKNKEKFVPISDGSFFRPSKAQNLQQIEGYYMFKNNKFLPGLIPSAEIWIKIEGYQTAKSSSEKNCVVITFLVPENVGGKIQSNTYVLKADGKLQAMEGVALANLSQAKNFSDYWILPLNDPNDNTHLVGKGLAVLGSMVSQQFCKNLKGIIYALNTNAGNQSSIFFRKVETDRAVKF